MKSVKYKIGHICELIKGKYSSTKTEPGPYPLVVTAENRRMADSYQFDQPAVCVPLISSTGHGHAALHRVHYEEGKFALADLLVALIPQDPQICFTKYLYHLLMAKKNEYFVPLMLGTANVSLKIQDIAEVEITLPPLDEQRRIVAYIEALAARIAEARGLRQQVQDEQQVMLFGLYNRLTDHAKLMPMSEIAPLVRRPIDIKDDEMYHELGIRSFGNGTFHKSPLTGFELGSKRVFQIEPDDLLFSNVFAWEGAIAVAKSEDKGRIGSHRFITCVPKDGVATARFLCFHFLTPKGLHDIGQASPGGAGRNRTLGLEKLERIMVPVPDYENQVWFNDLYARVDLLKRLQAETATELGALLPAVLDRAFPGELL
jgi:hypothetical protein